MTLLALGFACENVAAEPCPTVVLVRGEESLRQQLASALVERAIVTEPQGGCPATVVEVARNDGGLSVFITDVVGRVSDRRVADVSTAASLVESWARSDLDGALLEVRRPVVAQVDASETPTVLVHASPAVDARRALRLSFDASSAVGSDRSLWVGLAAHACVRLGPTCPGVMVRMSQDTEVSGDSETLETARRAIDLGITLDVPRVHDGWSWTPGVSIGLALSRSRYNPEYAAEMENIESDGGALRGGAHIGVSKLIAHRWSLGVDIAVDSSLFSPADSSDDESVRLAEQPRSFLRGAIELRYEGM